MLLALRHIKLLNMFLPPLHTITSSIPSLSVSHADAQHNVANSDDTAPYAPADLDPYLRTTNHHHLVDSIDRRSDLRRPFHASRTAGDQDRSWRGISCLAVRGADRSILLGHRSRSGLTLLAFGGRSAYCWRFLYC